MGPACFSVFFLASYTVFLPNNSAGQKITSQVTTSSDRLPPPPWMLVGATMGTEKERNVATVRGAPLPQEGWRKGLTSQALQAAGREPTSLMNTNDVYSDPSFGGDSLVSETGAPRLQD